MLRTFNMGVGLIVVVAREEVEALRAGLVAHGEGVSSVIGVIESGGARVVEYREMPEMGSGVI
jgi:phosphoribosylaminoimidazole (AIR) synthetase